jgi:restriction system protein
MKNFYQLRLGQGAKHFSECFSEGFVGVGWFANLDLTKKLNDSPEWRTFNRFMIPIYLKDYPERNKIAAGLACAATYTVGKSLLMGDIVMCPKGDGTYAVGEIASDYLFVPDANLPHRRKVNWRSGLLERTKFSPELSNTVRSINTLSNLNHHSSEIEALIGDKPVVKVFTQDGDIESTSQFVFEEHLEEFLIKNWNKTELSQKYDLFEAFGETGQQYPTDTGPMDILAISKDKKELLVIELKRGRASDKVVGQIQRYMGYVKDELAEEGQSVKGMIIGATEDIKLKRSLSVASNIEFYRYLIDFKLVKGSNSLSEE